MKTPRSSSPQVARQTTTPTSEWHWAEGTKYAIEGIKTLLLLNGGAAIALMTFLGHSNVVAINMATAGRSLVLFAFGALLAAFDFLFAYLSQLHYGNKNDRIAMRWHFVVYVVFFTSAGCFLYGILQARTAIGA